MERDLVAAGTRQIALGAISGWALSGLYADPKLRAKAGVNDIVRLRQAHVDFIIMGGLLTAAGVVDGTPTWAKRAAAIGGWTNPLLFVPMAFRDDVMKSKGYLAASVASFVVTTAGWLGIANAARRWAKNSV